MQSTTKCMLTTSSQVQSGQRSSSCVQPTALSASCLLQSGGAAGASSACNANDDSYGLWSIQKSNCQARLAGASPSPLLHLGLQCKSCSVACMLDHTLQSLDCLQLCQVRRRWGIGCASACIRCHTEGFIPSHRRLHSITQRWTVGVANGQLLISQNKPVPT